MTEHPSPPRPRGFPEQGLLSWWPTVAARAAPWEELAKACRVGPGWPQGSPEGREAGRAQGVASPGESPERVREAVSLPFAGALVLLILPTRTRTSRILKSPSRETVRLGFKPRRSQPLYPSPTETRKQAASSPTHSVTCHSCGDQVLPSERRTLEDSDTPPAPGSRPSQELGETPVRGGPCTNLGLGRVGWTLRVPRPPHAHSPLLPSYRTLTLCLLKVPHFSVSLEDRGNRVTKFLPRTRERHRALFLGKHLRREARTQTALSASSFVPPRTGM